MNATIEPNTDRKEIGHSFESTSDSEFTFNRCFVFREPETPSELLALLRLRYRVYQGSRLKGFVPENEDNLDIDPWDKYAAHYGLFIRESEIEEPIGYIRVVGQSLWHKVALLESLAVRYKSIRASLEAAPKAPLPLLTYAEDPAAVSRIREDLKACRRPIVEPGRLSLDPQYASCRLSIEVIRNIIALYLRHFRIEYAVLICAVDHRAVYEKLGFQGIGSLISWKCDKAEHSFSSVLLGSPRTIPFRLRQRLQRRIREFASTGRIVFSTTSPSHDSNDPATDSKGAAQCSPE